MKRTFLTALTTLLAVLPLLAQPTDGKYYRLTNQRDHDGKRDLVMYEDWISSNVRCTATSDNSDYTQLWQLCREGNGYTLRNAYSGNYIQYQTSTSNIFHTDSTPRTFAVTANGSYYNIAATAGGSGMHCDASNNVVLWWDSAADGNKWTLSEVTVSEEAVALNIAAYQTFREQRDAAQAEVNDATAHLADYKAKLQAVFNDETCTELTPAAATLSDDALREALAGLPATLIDMALKVKNASWSHREEEFRIRTYKAYSEPDYWGKLLYTKMWCRMNNPTGISAGPTDVIYAFVENDAPAGSDLWMEAIVGTGVSGTKYPLHKGLNVFRAAEPTMLFLQYVANTTVDGAKLITDYAPVRVHIEGGRVDGFFEKGVHDDADWVDISQNLSQSKAIQIKGDYILMNLDRSYVTAAKCCPNAISDAIGWWDNMIMWQRSLLGVDDVVPSRCNNLACAISLDGGYQSATNYRTQYAANYIHNLLPYANMMSNADNCWGPGHENGHTHQHAIQTIGTAESSNNLFSNLTLNKLGKYLSRGNANKQIYDDYAAGAPWTGRDIGSTHRMYWQLYLYFHEAGFDPTFYPRLFQMMREKPLTARATSRRSVTGFEDALCFARNVCDVAQMDLSPFFTYWGFCTPTDHLHVDDYGDFDITCTQQEIDSFLVYVSRYPKGPAIEFIEDRIKPVPRTDGVSGDKLKNGVSGTSAGNVGHYTDYMDLSVKAEGYLYNLKSSTVTISGGQGAVGFRIYDADDGRLLYGSNLLTFALPQSAEHRNLRIVACQPDGTEVPVLSAAEAGTESQQLSALTASLATARDILNLSDSTGTHLGWYVSELLEPLQQLYDKAMEARRTSDQSAHTYGQWATMLDRAVNEVAQMAEARIPLYEENLYGLTMNAYDRYSAIYLSAGPKGTLADPAATPDKQWQLVPTGTADCYFLYIPSADMYVSRCTLDTRVRAASSSASDAIVFVLEPYALGTYTLRVQGQNSLYMGYNSSKEVVGSKDASASQWQLTVAVDHHAEAVAIQADALLALAKAILNETTVQTDPLTLVDGIEPVEDADIAALVATLATADSDTRAALSASPALLALRLTALSAALDAIEGTYTVPAVMPTVSSDREHAVLYAIQDVTSGAWCTYDAARGRIKTDDILDVANDDFLFMLLPADGGTHIVSVATGSAVSTSSNYLYVNGKYDDLPFTFAPAGDGRSLLVTNGSKGWTAGSSHTVQLRSGGSGWRFLNLGERTTTAIRPAELSEEETSTFSPLPSNFCYDLQGRRVDNPTRGIYIVGGKKVLVP